MQRWKTPILLLLFSAGVYYSHSTPLSDSVNALTGNVWTRLVWIQDGLRLYGGGSVMGFDSRTGEIKEILPPEQNQNKPILCTGGNRIVVSIDYKVYAVNWDGTGLKHITNGICSDVWVDPQTGKEWVFVRKGTNNTSGPVYKYVIDSPSDSALVWDLSGEGDYYMNWWQVSADGALAVDFLPWNRCFVIQNGGIESNGFRKGFGRGCWSSLAPDSSYYSFHFADAKGHGTLRVYKYLDSIADVVIDAGPLPDSTLPHEFFHPRFASNGARYLTVTGGYLQVNTESNLAEVYFGKFSQDYKSFQKWVRITYDSVIQITPDAWIGVTPPAPSMLLSSDALAFTQKEGDLTVSAQNVIVTSRQGAPGAITGLSSAPWLQVAVSGADTMYTVRNQIKAPELKSGLYRAAVTLHAPNAVPQDVRYSVTLAVTGTPVVSSIRINPSIITVVAGQQTVFKATVLDQSDSIMSRYPALQWHTTGASGSSIDSLGVFTAGTGTGICTVTVSYGSVKTAASVYVIRSADKPININTPEACSTYYTGRTMEIKWDATGILYTLIFISFDSSRTWYPLTKTALSRWALNYGQYRWQITPELSVPDAEKISTISDKVFIKVFDKLDTATKDIAGPFSIKNGIILLPFSRSDYNVGDTINIQWTSEDNVTGVLIEISVDQGKTWHSIVNKTITTDLPEWGAYKWIIPEYIEDSTSTVMYGLMVRVSSYTNAEINGISKSVNIWPVDSLKRSLILSSHDYWVGDTVTLSWTSDTGFMRPYAVYISTDTGNSWKLVDSSVNNTLYSFIVTPQNAIDYKKTCQLRVTNKNAFVYSDLFYIHPYPLSFLSGSGTFTSRQSLTVFWRCDTLRVQNAKLGISSDSGKIWFTIKDTIRLDSMYGKFVFSVPDSIAKIDFMIKISSIPPRYADTCLALPSTDNFESDTIAGTRRNGCGCGTGTGLALIPPIVFKMRRILRKKSRKHLS